MPSDDCSETSSRPALMHRVVLGAVLGTVLGALLGIPLSYWLQAGAIRAFLSLPDYLRLVSEYLRLSKELGIPSVDIAGVLSTIRLSMLITGIAGFFVGGTLADRQLVDGRMQSSGDFFRLTLRVSEFSIYLVVIHIATYFVLAVASWFAANSSMRALRPDGAVIEEQRFGVPLVQFWDLSLYNPSWIWGAELLLGIVIIVAVWQYRTLKSNRSKLQR